MMRTHRATSGYPGPWEHLVLARDGLVLARRAAPRDEAAARREIRRARGELQKALRFLVPRRELAPLLAPLMSLVLELGELLAPLE